MSVTNRVNYLVIATALNSERFYQETHKKLQLDDE